MDVQHGKLVMETPGDSKRMLAIAEHTDFLLFDLKRRNDLSTNFPNTLNPSETHMIVSIAMSKIYTGVNGGSRLEQREAKRATDFMGSIANLALRQSLEVDTTVAAQTDLVRQVIHAVKTPEARPQSA
jgi:hypothetical protein